MPPTARHLDTVVAQYSKKYRYMVMQPYLHLIFKLKSYPFSDLVHFPYGLLNFSLPLPVPVIFSYLKHRTVGWNPSHGRESVAQKAM